MQILPEHDSGEPDHAKDGAQHQSSGQLADGDPPPVAELELLKCERSYHERGRLRTGITAGAHDERDKHREHGGPLDLTLKALHRRRRQHLAQEQRAQPTRPLLDHLHKSDFHVRRVEGLHTSEALDVFGRLLHQSIDHVVNRDDAEHASLIVDDRKCEQVVLGDEPSRFFAVHIRRDCQRRSPVADVEHVILALGGQQLA